MSTAPPGGQAAVARLQQQLGHDFQRPELLHQALTHPSVAYAGPKLAPKGPGRAPRATPYERLEFLGDRVLGLVIAELLFESFPDEPEGHLARRHVALVRRESLALVAGRIGLGDALSISKGEEAGGGRANPSLLADACEAVIGALYADGGFDVARGAVRRLWTGLMAEPVAPPKDAKTALQEWAQARGKPLPAYRMLGQEGPAHEPLFKVEVGVEGLDPVIGTGSTKRAAEQMAAQTLLECIKA